MFEVWSDNELEAYWFEGLDSRLQGARTELIKRRGQNPDVVENLIAYDRPDVILLFDGQPVLVLEKTREVPTGHNVGQRFARLARAAEHGVPTIFFLPFDSRKHGRYSSMCNINTRLLRAMLNMGKIHGTSCLAVSWPADTSGELIVSGEENLQVGLLVQELISLKLGIPVDRSAISDHLEWLRREIADREAAFPKYRNLPNSAFFVETEVFLGQLARTLAPASRVMTRNRSLVYKIDMSPSKARRQDPYTGTQFIYDYGWLRKGPLPSDRETNLILWIPRVSKDLWLQLNPRDFSSKSCNWYLIADAIVLSDGIISLETWVDSDVD